METQWMLTTEDGRFFYYGENGSISTGVFTVSGNTFSGPEYLASLRSGSCSDAGLCAAAPEGTDTGTFSVATILTFNNGDTWSYNNLYNNPSSLAAIAGAWSSGLDVSSGATYTITPGVLNISASGVILQDDTATSGCVINGQVSLIDPLYNAYSIALTYTGTGCWSNGGTGQGIAYIDYVANPISLDMAINLQASGSSQTTDIIALNAPKM
jgi:hypothetical protein